MKNKAQRIKLVSFVSLLLILICIFPSCVSFSEEDEATLKALATEITNEIIAENNEALYTLFDSEYIPKETVDEVVPTIREYMSNPKSFSLKERTGWNVRTSGGITLVNASFIAEADGVLYQISITKRQDRSTACGFQIVKREDASPTYTGTIGKMQGATPLQWAVLIIGIAMMAFSFWMLVDCMRSKIKKKIWWILLILFIFLSVTFTIDPYDSVRLHFGIGFFLRSTALYSYSTGATVLSLNLPLGALIYFFMRKKFKTSANKEKQKEEEINTELSYGEYPLKEADAFDESNSEETKEDSFEPLENIETKEDTEKQNNK